MNGWKILTLVGKDRPAIAATITHALSDIEVSLGEASMMRLGGNFTLMLMIQTELDTEAFNQRMRRVVDELDLTFQFQDVQTNPNHPKIPDTCVTIYQADQAKSVARVTSALADVGFNIMDLESNLSQQNDGTRYIMQIEGKAKHQLEQVEDAVKALAKEGINVEISTIDTLIG